MRFPNQRLAQLFDLLQNETLPQDELAQRLSVSTRTVRADITALNALLASHGAQFILSRGNGYQLKIEDAERYQQLQASHPRALRIPRTGPERVHYLVVRFLTSAFSLKLEDLADEWFVSRATLQSDMAEVRECFHRYNLTLETRPRHGMKLFGSEMSVRACLTDLLWELAQQDSLNPLVTDVALNAGVAVVSRASMVNAGILTRKDFRQLRNILDSLMNKAGRASVYAQGQRGARGGDADTAPQNFRAQGLSGRQSTVMSKGAGGCVSGRAHGKRGLAALRSRAARAMQLLNCSQRAPASAPAPASTIST